MDVVSQRDLALLPKAHLHLHFTGSMRPATLVELAEEQGRRLPPSLRSAATIPDSLRLPATQRGWFRFQHLYDAARAVVDSEAVMRRIVREAAQDDAAEGSRRLELQVDPTSYAKFVGGITPALEIILDEARAASADTGVEVAIIVAASRIRHPLEARTLARLAARHAGRVIGFGLSNDERRGDTGAFGPAFEIAQRAGLALVPHGGELLGPAHVREVVDALHPDRIGHGVRSVEDPALLARLVEAGVSLELCPGSNVSLGVYGQAESVPLTRLMAAGAQIALGADDPLLFGSRLVDQYRIAREVHGVDDTGLARLAAGSIRASRAEETTKARLLAGVDAWLADVPGAGPGISRG
ncbi:adenosine deaminase [Pseudactinotalea sp. HY160]|uniref:adenosine deaminase n=1 Tax=Pseudactinotalea sp. HY160 TaxID=2654490 RepID=UPI00128AF04F|nr:adenosine deaminase [Pseudactinotalea sp. HY160]MPV50964.1 adenosine deaminase [Pseudactinotalea sp. HY160]